MGVLRHAWVAPALACTVALAAQGQQPVFRGGVRLVTIHVTVVDGDGRPVRNLAPADFDVEINGTRRAVQTVDFLEFGAAPVASPDGRAVAPASPSTAARASRGGRTFLLLFDDLSFTPLQGKGLAAAAERMLQNLDPGDLVAVATTSGLGPVVEPTRDRDAVRPAIATLAGRNTETAEPFYIGVNEAIAMNLGFDRRAAARVVARECREVNLGEQCAGLVKSMALRLAAHAHRRFEDQLAALTQVMSAMARAPAPRVIVMISAGTAVESAPDLKAAMDAMSDRASASGVQLYAVVDLGDDIDLRDRTEERSTARREETIVLTQGMQTITHAAGGTTFRVIGTADRFFDRIVAETSALYELGVELPETVDPRGALRTDVAVRRRGLSVRSTGRAIEKTAALPRDEAMRVRLAQGGVSYGVPLSVATRVRKHTGPGVQVVVDARVPADVALPLSLRFALIDARGLTAFAAQKDIAGTTAAEHQVVVPLPVPSGAYRLRVVAADGPGSIGSIETPVAAELTRVGDFEVSDLLITAAGAAGERFSAAEQLPFGSERITAVIELHPRAAMPERVSVRFSLLPADEAAILQEQLATPSLAGDRWTAAGALTVATLQPGRYLVRAEILHSGTVIGSLSRLFKR